MKTWKLVAWAALAAGLVATAPASASAQVGSLIKKKVKEKVVQKVAGSDTGAASPDAPGAPSGVGPVFNSYVLEITPELLDKLTVGLAAEAAKREENARRVGKVLSEEEYKRCTDAWTLSPEGRKFGEETMETIQEAKSDKDLQSKMEARGKKLDALMVSKCGLEPFKAKQLRQELASLPAVAGQEATGLNGTQWSILKERILPLCSMPEAAEELAAGARVPTDDVKIFYVYTPAEVEALRPRCGTLVQALRAGA